ncbi:MAG: aminodeoxychorismate/anthranilate synthase component II [Candidatus Dadabacteria bacterium]|nr:MAG: aminodeoxychorismate/anthranilate synthase component II [Candidatus Dadabacteria bacterium]
MAAKLVLIDNYDSFTYNLYQQLLVAAENTPLSVTVYRNDSVDAATVLSLGFDGLVISPGPGWPDDSGISKELIRQWPKDKPLLGVCLGHQTLAAVCGAKIRRSIKPLHGKTSKVQLKDSTLFKKLPDKIEVMRYHSLVVSSDSLPQELEVTATDENGEIMALEHKTRKAWGIQFHPESFLTPAGNQIIRNFLEELRE